MLIARRSLLAAAAAAPFLVNGRRVIAAERQAGMRAQRLAWAGVRLEFASSTVFLDPLTDPEVWGDDLKDRMIPVGDGRGSRFVTSSL